WDKGVLKYTAMEVWSTSRRIAKCTFDRRIRLSDTVYMETLYDVPNTSSPLTTFLEPSNRVWADGTKESEKSDAHL
ncbi:hypothetical protein MKW92_015881, partial [Papaver armeniacum]